MHNRLFPVLLLIALVGVPGLVAAQPAEEAVDDEAGQEPDEEAEEDLEDEGWEDDDWDEEEGDEEGEAESEEEPLSFEEEPLDEASAEDAEALLEQAAPDASDPIRRKWTAFKPVVTLHGYMRTRGEFQDKFNLGRTAARGVNAPGIPFERYTPASVDSSVVGGCTGDMGTATETGCFTKDNRHTFANMRLRLAPTLSLGENVHVHTMFDVFDNMVLGTNPNSVPLLGGAGAEGRVPGVPLDALSSTLLPRTANDLRDSIYVRRVWAEVTNRDIGQLRFGRMAHHHGMGMLYNAGNGLDADVSSDIDRVMGVAHYADFYLGGSWDFVNEGAIRYSTPVDAVPLDATQRDDVRQWSVLGAFRRDPEDEEARARRGEWNERAGLYFLYRKQAYSSFASDPTAVPLELTRRRAQILTLDAHTKVWWKGLRLEVEAAMIWGSVDNIGNGEASDQNYRLRNFGIAFEGEYRLLEDQLGIRFYSGYATGDRDVDGLSIYDDLYLQQSNDTRISTFSFHPNYRVDLILFRNILGAVSGAWYLRPGIEYDIVRTPFGRRLGLGADVIYSRAAQEVQAYGRNPNLGVEIDASLYYQSEDGPDLFDGFHVMIQYGILFPLAGLSVFGQVDAPGVKNAQALRLVLGVAF
jgi:uncharacterized protein (TIGR04551 family)